MSISEHPDGADSWLDIGDKLLASASFYLSSRGHEDIVNRVREIVDIVGVSKCRRVDQFSCVVQCYNWLLSGVIGDALKFGPNGKIIKMSNSEKFALEFDDSDHNASWIAVENNSNQEMKLSVGYMTTGPVPEAPTSFGNKPVHISRRASLGNMAPMTHKRVYFKPLESTEWPFRLVQVMITPHRQ